MNGLGRDVGHDVKLEAHAQPADGSLERDTPYQAATTRPASLG